MADTTEFTNKDLRLVVIGASAGGLEALLKFLPDLPKHFPAAVLVVIHLPAEAKMEVIVRALQQKTKLHCQIAYNGQHLEPGNIYLPAADHHLLVAEGKIVLSHGAHENRWRPGIDPLFRSAAVAFGPAVTGVVLTGLLDDGTAGMSAIKRCGGTTIVQDPATAQFPDMPQHVLNNVPIDFRVTLEELGKQLSELVSRPLGAPVNIPEAIKLENDFSLRMMSSRDEIKELGELSGFTCPSCGGPLAEVKDEANPRFRCFTGHTFAAHTFLNSKASELEEAIWAAVRILEERRNMYRLMAKRKQEQAEPGVSGASQLEERALQAERYVMQLRDALAQLNASEEKEKPLAK